MHAHMVYFLVSQESFKGLNVNKISNIIGCVARDVSWITYSLEELRK